MSRPRIGAPLLGLLVAAVAVSGCTTSPRDAPAGSPEAVDLPGPLEPFRPGRYLFDETFSQVLELGPLKAKPPVRTLIKSEVDGADIEVGYWLPDVAEGTRVPVLVHASPYHRPAGSVIQDTGTKRFLTHNFLPHGYAVAAVAVRGTGDSGGCMELMGAREVADLSQAVTWLGTQPWSNGNVGMTGLSYDGTTPWAVASTGNPHLKTIVPISGVNDFYGLMYKNGSAELRGQVLLNWAYYEYGWSPVGTVGGGTEDKRTLQHRLEGVVCPEAWEGLAWSGYSTVEGGRDPQGWWAERNLRPGVEQNYRGSILLVHGLVDWNVDPSMSQPWVETLNATGVPVHQILGRWGHTSPDRKGGGADALQPHHRMDYAQKLLDWFDHWLKNETAATLGAPVTVQDNTYRWRVEEHWPPRDANWTTFHLAGGNELRTQPAEAGKVLLVPNPIGDNPAQATLKDAPGYAADFYTEPLPATVNVAGLPRVHVTVSPYGPNGHLAAWLYDVDPQGTATPIGWTTMNLRFYNADEESHVLTPQQPILARMEIQPMDARVEAGHRILLRLWQYSSDDHLGLPIVKDRNTPLPSQPVDVLYGGQTLSTLELPIVQRDASHYFRPPMPEGYRFPYET